jgi:hypothetical protein
MKAVAKEIKSTNISFGSKEVASMGDIFQARVGDEVINTIKNIVTGLIASETIEAALWPCMERGTYTSGGVINKINRDLFEDEKARADYIPILKEALVYNLSPFLKSLKSLLKDIPAVGTGSLK